MLHRSLALLALVDAILVQEVLHSCRPKQRLHAKSLSVDTASPITRKSRQLPFAPSRTERCRQKHSKQRRKSLQVLTFQYLKW